MYKSQMIKKACLLSLITLSPLVFTGCVAFAVGAGAAGATAVISSDSRGVDTMAYDQTIESRALDIINSNKELSNYNETAMTVISVNGNVLLAGQTIHRAYAQWCAQKIQKLDYVRKVYNYVQVKRPVSAKVVARDTYITSEIKAQLLLAKDISSNRFKIYTEDGNVFILGYVTPDEARRAVNQVLKVSGIKKIYTIFDYITNEANLKADGENAIKVIPVNHGTASKGRSSTYVPPVRQSDNGGAMIVDDGPSVSLEEQGAASNNNQYDFTPVQDNQYGDELVTPSNDLNGGAMIVDDTSSSF